MTAWLSSTGISHHDLLPHTTLIFLSTDNRGPPQSLNSSSQLLRLPGDQHRGMYVYSKDCLILIPFGLPQVSCFTLSLKYFSSGSDPLLWGSDPCLSSHKPLKAGPVLLTLLFFPLVPFSHRVLRSSVYSFPLVKYYCLLSAGVLHALLCLKVYS